MRSLKMNMISVRLLVKYAIKCHLKSMYPEEFILLESSDKEKQIQKIKADAGLSLTRAYTVQLSGKLDIGGEMSEMVKDVYKKVVEFLPSPQQPKKDKVNIQTETDKVRSVQEMNISELKQYLHDFKPLSDAQGREPSEPYNIVKQASNTETDYHHNIKPSDQYGQIGQNQQEPHNIFNTNSEIKDHHDRLKPEQQGPEQEETHSIYTLSTPVHHGLPDIGALFNIFNLFKPSPEQEEPHNILKPTPEEEPHNILKPSPEQNDHQHRLKPEQQKPEQEELHSISDPPPSPQIKEHHHHHHHSVQSPPAQDGQQQEPHNTFKSALSQQETEQKGATYHIFKPTTNPDNGNIPDETPKRDGHRHHTKRKIRQRKVTFIDRYLSDLASD